MGIRNIIMTYLWGVLHRFAASSFCRVETRRFALGLAPRPRYPRHLQQLGLQTHQGALPERELRGFTTRHSNWEVFIFWYTNSYQRNNDDSS